jgi:HSP20 family protein
MLQTYYYEPLSRLYPELKSSRVKREKDSAWSPRVDIVETRAEYQLLMDLPGINPETINLTQEKQLLTVEAERKSRELAEGETMTRAERKTGVYKRQFTLPDDADVGSIQANCKDGVLTLSIARKIEQETVRKIDIQH